MTLSAAFGLLAPGAATYLLLRLSDWVCPPGADHFLLGI